MQISVKNPKGKIIIIEVEPSDLIEDVKLLLEQYGFEVNKATIYDGSTLLYTVCEQGYAKIVTMLLAQDGIDVNKARTTDGATPLYSACYEGHSEVVKLLLAQDGIDVNKAETDLGFTPLCMACLSGNTEISKLLLEQDGIEVNKATTDNGSTPLYIACQEGYTQIVKLLLAQDGIEVNNAMTDDGSTPLHMACQEGHTEIVKLMLAHNGIEVNKATTDDGSTPLFMACQEGHTEIVKRLLAHNGIEVNKATTDDGYTPLHAAVRSEKPLVAQLLVLYGASLTTLTYDGDSPAQDAMTYHQQELAEWLTTVAGRSQPRVAAGNWFHKEATIMLRQGEINPDTLPFPEILAAIAKPIADTTLFSWSNAPPVCKRNSKLVIDATRGWHRTTHWLHHVGVQKAVFTVLVVAKQLQEKDAKQLQEKDANQLFPFLPPEIWFYIMRFFLRSWWAVNEM